MFAYDTILVCHVNRKYNDSMNVDALVLKLWAVNSNPCNDEMWFESAGING